MCTTLNDIEILYDNSQYAHQDRDKLLSSMKKLDERYNEYAGAPSLTGAKVTHLEYAEELMMAKQTHKELVQCLEKRLEYIVRVQSLLCANSKNIPRAGSHDNNDTDVYGFQ